MFTKGSAEACSPYSCHQVFWKLLQSHVQEQQWLWTSEGRRIWLNISNLLEKLILVIF